MNPTHLALLIPTIVTFALSTAQASTESFDTIPDVERPELRLGEDDKEIAVKIIAEDIRVNERRIETNDQIANEIRPYVLPIQVEIDDSNEPSPKTKKKSPGRFSITWGYHRGWISKSDVHFKSADGSYDFVAYDVKAYDRPAWDAAIPKKGKPYRFDVPQYQVSLRYTLPAAEGKRVRFGIKLQQIHSKYIPVLELEKRHTEGQDVWIRGKWLDGQQWDGMGKVATYATGYWEYTDGLNEATLGAFMEYDLAAKKKIRVSSTLGLNAGFVIPATKSDINGLNRDHHFDVSGQVFQVDGGLKVTFWNVFFLESLGTASFVNMTNARLADGGKIQQKFFHTKVLTNMGFNIRINPSKKYR